MLQKKSLKTMLVVGVSLLIAFGAVACRHHGTPEKMAAKIVDRIAAELDLSGPQNDELNAIKDEVLIKIIEFKRAHKAIRDEVLDQMKNDAIDPAVIKEMIKAQQTKKEEAVALLIDRLADFYSTLTPEQKQKVIEHLESGGRDCFFGGSHHRLMDE